MRRVVKKRRRRKAARYLLNFLLGTLFDLKFTLHFVQSPSCACVCVCVISTVRGMLMYCTCKGLLGLCVCVNLLISIVRDTPYVLCM